jgi:hypothetical protein
MNKEKSDIEKFRETFKKEIELASDYSYRIGGKHIAIFDVYELEEFILNLK